MKRANKDTSQSDSLHGGRDMQTFPSLILARHLSVNETMRFDTGGYKKKKRAVPLYTNADQAVCTGFFQADEVVALRATPLQ